MQGSENVHSPVYLPSVYIVEVCVCVLTLQDIFYVAIIHLGLPTYFPFYFTLYSLCTCKLPYGIIFILTKEDILNVFPLAGPSGDYFSLAFCKNVFLSRLL